jgi:hypothetical protein
MKWGQNLFNQGALGKVLGGAVVTIGAIMKTTGWALTKFTAVET